MLTSTKQQTYREDEEGFTLIELMVVLLIIAILLAIAIPTFLSTRNTANARATQSNLNTAITTEQTYWTQNQTFGSDTDLGSQEASLSWTSSLSAGGNNVNVTQFTGTGGTDDVTWAAYTTGTADGVAIQGLAKDGNCYTVFLSNNPSASFTAYNVDKGASCPAITAANAPTADPTATSATGASGAPAAGTWATGW